MTAYVDANLLVRLYLDFDGKQEAHDLLMGAEMRKAWPIQVTTLLRIEFTNALQRMVFESRTGGQWRVSPEAAAAALGEFHEHLRAGVFLKTIELSLEEVESQFDELAARHTARHGFRTYDVLHVACALRLRCERFLSFDVKARRLAKLEGLKTN
jgi:predicted nucleic acid-binding protein